MSIDRKRVTLHPLKEDGTMDENINLYPKTFLDGIVDREGNEVEVATREDIPTDIVTHEELEESLTKENVGLGNVDNTSDIDKPISTAQQQALNLKSNATNLENGQGQDSLQQVECNSFGRKSFAEGYGTVTFGTASHAEGFGMGQWCITFGERIGTSTTPYSYNYTFNPSANRTLLKPDKYLNVNIFNDTYYLKVTYVDENEIRFDSLTNNLPNLRNAIGWLMGGVAGGTDSHVEGNQSTASGDYSHAEGYFTFASGEYSHAEGDTTTASAARSHAEGNMTIASGENAHVEGYQTIASYSNQHVSGKFNDNKSNTLLEIGNGTYYTRSNAFEVYQDGHAEVGLMGDTNNSVATKEYVDTNKGTKLYKHEIHCYYHTFTMINNVATAYNALQAATGVPFRDMSVFGFYCESEFTNGKGRGLYANLDINGLKIVYFDSVSGQIETVTNTSAISGWSDTVTEL